VLIVLCNGRRRRQDKTNLSKKKKREGDDEWGEGKKVEKFEVHSIKEEAPSQGTLFSPTLQFLSQVSILFAFFKTHSKFEKATKNKQTNKTYCAFA
jgi:hypothetical protein